MDPDATSLFPAKNGDITAVSPDPPVHESYELANIPVLVTIKSKPGGLFYDITEPLLNSYEEELYRSLRLSLRVHLSDKELYREYQENFTEKLHDLMVSVAPDLADSSMQVLSYYLTRDTKGFGALQPYLEDVNLVRVSLPGYGTAARVRHSRHGLLMTAYIPSESDMKRIIKKAENRAGKKINPDSLPEVLTLPNGIMQITSSPGSLHGTYGIDFIRPDMQITGSGEYVVQNKKTIAKSTYLKGSAWGILIADERGLYQFKVGCAPVRVEIGKEYSELLSWAKNNHLDGRCETDIVQALQDRMKSRYPGLSTASRGYLATRLVLSLSFSRRIRLLMTDPNILAIFCKANSKRVNILHKKSPRLVGTNLSVRPEDLKNLISFFCQSAGKEEKPEEKTSTLRFRGGTTVVITRDSPGKNPQVEIHTAHAEAGGGVSRPAGSADPVIPHLRDAKSDEVLSRVFDLAHTSRKSEDAGEKDDDPGEDDDERNSWSDRLKKTLQFTIKLDDFRRKRRPDPNRKAPDPGTPQVKSVLDVQVPEGLVAEEAYWLVSPHAYAVVLKDPAGDRIYRVIEPDLSPRERIVLEETHETLRDVLIYDKPVNKGGLFLDYEETAKVIRTYDPTISDDRLSVLFYYLKRNLNGYGKIDALMHDEMLEDISCNGHHLPVYIHHRIYASMPTTIVFDQEELNRFVLKLSQKADKQVSITSPLLDAALPNGSRAQITYSDIVSTKGSSFTIRKFRTDPMTPITLLGFGTYDTDLLAFLWLALENRKSLIVVGGTASGKTSAMNALSFFIPHNSKIVSLEDTRELQIPHRNWLPVQTRESAALHERGNIDLFDLLKASLRQRPEYIIVGEVRGSEAQTLFQAMNSGHTTLSTLHAGTIEEALNRLTNEPINVPPAMFGALDLMVIQTFHYRGGKMIRRCDAVHEIVLQEGDRLGWNTLYEYNPASDGFDKRYTKSKTLQNIRYMHNWTEPELQYHLSIRKEFLTRIRSQPHSDPVALMQYITRLRRLA